jgi:hypothetical protein
LFIENDSALKIDFFFQIETKNQKKKDKIMETKEVETTAIPRKPIPKALPKIPIRLVKLSDLKESASKTLKGTRSNHFILIEKSNKASVTIFTNQRIHQLDVIGKKFILFCYFILFIFS